MDPPSWSIEPRPFVAASALITGIAAVNYLVIEPALPRPIWLFGAIGTSLTLLFVGLLLADSIGPSELLRIGGIGLLDGLVLRMSGYSEVVVSGIDHGRWLLRVDEMTRTGTITGSDMYSAAPFYLLELVLSRIVANLGLTQTRFVTILVASFLPLAIYVLAHTLTGNRRVSLAALLFAAAQMLFLRTSALLEAESMAIGWSIVALYLLFHYLQRGDQRTLYLFVVITSLSVFLHFLYATVIFGIGAGTLALLFLLQRTPGITRPLDREQVRRLLVATTITGTLIPAYMLTSTYSGVARDVIASAFDDRTSQPPETPDSGDGGAPSGGGSTPIEGSTGSTPTSPPSAELTTDAPPGPPVDDGGESIFEWIVSTIVEKVTGFLLALVPSTGSAGQGVGAGTWTTPVALLGAFVPLVSFLSVSGAGGLVVLRRRSRTDVFLLATGATVVVASLVGVLADLEFRLGFRLYYFLAAVLVVFAAIGSVRLSRSDHRAQGALTALVVVLFFSYATLGPMSPLGNNVDPKFGGTSWYLTASEYEQLPTYGEVFDEGELIDHEVSQTPKHLRLYSHNDDLYLTRDTCERDGVVMTTGALRVCQRADVG